MITPENTTIVITTYDELECLKLSIYSLLELYPQFKESIKVFDDYSHPEISTWLEQEGIERITWLNKTFISNFQDYTKIYPITSTSLRNSWMISEIMEKHINTPYVMINDNDVIFFKSGFIEHYDDLFSKGYKALAQYEEYNYNWEFIDRYDDAMIDGYLGKYSILYDKSKKVMRRLHWCHGMLDYAFFKNKGIFFDKQLDDKFIFLTLQGSITETGTDFFYQIESAGIKYYPLNNIFNRLYIGGRKRYLPINNAEFEALDGYHFRWLSSNKKIKDRLDGTILDKAESQAFNMNKKIKLDFDISSKLKKKVEYLINKYNIKYEYT